MKCEDCIIDNDDRQLARTFEDLVSRMCGNMHQNVCTVFFYQYVIDQANTKY